MTTAEQIREIIDRETLAWNTQDVDKLLSIFHPDMVWVWPKDSSLFDPMTWELPQGKFNQERWAKLYQNLFQSHDLIHNKRELLKMTISNENDGAFAIVDADTLWKNKKTGEEMRWLGRTGKTYTLIASGEWKMINQVGVFDSQVF